MNHALQFFQAQDVENDAAESRGPNFLAVMPGGAGGPPGNHRAKPGRFAFVPAVTVNHRIFLALFLKFGNQTTELACHLHK